MTFGLTWILVGGMLCAIRMINEAREQKAKSQGDLTVDVHPARPEFRGVMGAQPISLEADPTFDEIQTAGARLSKNDKPHTILDDKFLISGEIPRVTPYEVGLKRGIRFNTSTNSWEKDELIIDERLLMCHLKGLQRIPSAQILRLTGRQR